MAIRTRKESSKKNGKSKTQGIKFTQEKAGENKENEKLGKQKQNVEELTNKRDRKLHIWIERKDN